MNKLPSRDEIANDLLRDIEVAYGYMHPIKGRWLFEFLQPYYADKRESNLVVRILIAYECLESDAKSLFREALYEALERLLIDFQGSASRMLILLELNYLLNRETLSSRVWLRSLGCRNAGNVEINARLLEGIVDNFKKWNIKPNIRDFSWSNLLAEVSVSALPLAGEWLLSLTKDSPKDAIEIFRFAWDRVNKINQVQLSEYWPEKSEIYEILFNSFLQPEVSLKEKSCFLREHRLPTPGEMAKITEQKMRAEMQGFSDHYYANFDDSEKELEVKLNKLFLEGQS